MQYRNCISFYSSVLLEFTWPKNMWCFSQNFLTDTIEKISLPIFVSIHTHKINTAFTSHCLQRDRNIQKRYVSLVYTYVARSAIIQPIGGMVKLEQTKSSYKAKVAVSQQKRKQDSRYSVHTVQFFSFFCPAPIFQERLLHTHSPPKWLWWEMLCLLLWSPCPYSWRGLCLGFSINPGQ